MTSPNKPVPPLSVRLVGPAFAAQPRISVNQLVLFAGQLQTAVQRIGRILHGQEKSLHPGPAPKEVLDTCWLDIVGLKQGSLELSFDLHAAQDTQQSVFGNLAIDRLITGMQQLEAESLSSEYPPGFDKGVLLAIRESGKLLEQGVDEIVFLGGLKRQSARYDSKVLQRVVERIQAPVINKVTVEGTLLMGDFKAGRYS